MIKFIIKTILQFVLILLCVSFISFLLVYLAPGDPAESILNAQGIPFTNGPEWQLYGAISGLAGQDCPWRLWCDL